MWHCDEDRVSRVQCGGSGVLQWPYSSQFISAVLYERIRSEGQLDMDGLGADNQSSNNDADSEDPSNQDSQDEDEGNDKQDKEPSPSDQEDNEEHSDTEAEAKHTDADDKNSESRESSAASNHDQSLGSEDSMSRTQPGSTVRDVDTHKTGDTHEWDADSEDNQVHRQSKKKRLPKCKAQSASESDGQTDSSSKHSRLPESAGHKRQRHPTATFKH